MGFDADGVKSFVERSNQVLTQLTSQATKYVEGADR
jgi:hypothetical protein